MLPAGLLQGPTMKPQSRMHDQPPGFLGKMMYVYEMYMFCAVWCADRSIDIPRMHLFKSCKHIGANCEEFSENCKTCIMAFDSY